MFTSMWRVISTWSKKAFFCSQQCLALQLRRMETQPRHQLLSVMFLPQLQVLPPCFLWPSRSREEPGIHINSASSHKAPLDFITFISSMTAGRLLSSFNDLWNWIILEWQNRLSLSADTPDPKQVRLTEEHTGQSTLTPQLPDPSWLAAATQHQSWQELLWGSRWVPHLLLEATNPQWSAEHSALRAALFVVGLDSKGLNSRCTRRALLILPLPNFI